MVKKQIVQFEENKKHAYALVIEQCSPNLDSKLQRSAAFDDVTTNTEDVEHFKALLVGMVKTYGGAYGCKPELLSTELEAQGVRPKEVPTAGNVEISKAKATCHKCYLSCMLLSVSHNGRYYQFKLDLSNDMTKGANNYPKTIVETMRMFTNYIPPWRLQRMRDPDGEGLAIIQGESGMPQ